MNFVVWILFLALLITIAAAGVIPKEEYLPPAAVEENDQAIEDSSALAEDGYRYKTVRKLRHRRDVSELFAKGNLAKDGYHYQVPKPAAPLLKVSQEYLPPVEIVPEIKQATEASKVVKEYLPPVEDIKEEVSETPEIVKEYLPPAEKIVEEKEVSEAPEIVKEYLPPVETAPATLDLPKFAAADELPSSVDDSVIIEGPEESAVLADDGYHYRRIRYRRDVSEIAPPSTDSEKSTDEANKSIDKPVEEEGIANEYLPPAEELQEATDEVPVETAELAEDGYRYKTIRKLKYRQRRDVSELVPSKPDADTEEISSTYLPPAEDQEPISNPTKASVEYLPPPAEVKEAVEEPSETAELAEDGYRYKTIRKLKYRLRRDVSHLLASESAVLTEDGYHYKIPEPAVVIPKISNEYLPPAEEMRELPEEPKPTEASVVTETSPEVTEAAPVITEATPVVTVPEIIVTEAPTTTTAAPIPSNEYLPPIEDIPALKEAATVPEETAVLADDGYHYKVGKRFRFRRDVSEIVDPSNGYTYEAPAATNEASSVYLPPVNMNEASKPIEEEATQNLAPAEQLQDDSEVVEVPEESAILGDDGYHYKTVRTLRYRHRRDVSELVAQNDESEILAHDGYHYKTPAPEADSDVVNVYLPPAEDVAEVKEALNIEPTLAPEKPGAEYLPPSSGEAAPKEASPVPSKEYLPPGEEPQGSAVVEEVPQSAVLADDGYHYKTVRRIRYRHRRDVSEIAAPQAEGYAYNAPVEAEPQTHYLPPVEELAQPKAAEETAILADDGYRYKTVRRIRYRHRV